MQKIGKKCKMAMQSDNNLTIRGGNSLNKTVRSSNIELFRIVTMFMIIAHHYVVNSGLTTGPYLCGSAFLEIAFSADFWRMGQDRNKLLCNDYRVFHVQVSHYC